jgi:hypothetical protein
VMCSYAKTFKAVSHRGTRRAQSNAKVLQRQTRALFPTGTKDPVSAHAASFAIMMFSLCSLCASWLDCT